MSSQHFLIHPNATPNATYSLLFHFVSRRYISSIVGRYVIPLLRHVCGDPASIAKQMNGKDVVSVPMKSVVEFVEPSLAGVYFGSRMVATFKAQLAAGCAVQAKEGEKARGKLVDLDKAMALAYPLFVYSDSMRAFSIVRAARLIQRWFKAGAWPPYNREKEDEEEEEEEEEEGGPTQEEEVQAHTRYSAITIPEAAPIETAAAKVPLPTQEAEEGEGGGQTQEDGQGEGKGTAVPAAVAVESASEKVPLPTQGAGEGEGGGQTQENGQGAGEGTAVPAAAPVESAAAKVPLSRELSSPRAKLANAIAADAAINN